MRLKVASRKSDLARWQSVQVARQFESLDEKPHIEFIFKTSLGDQDLVTPLAAMGAKGVFTEDLSSDLQNGLCDLVVHSWKDLPVEERAETQIAMTLPRADTRDLLLVPNQVWQQALRDKCLKVLTSSPRREYNLSSALPHLLPAAMKIEFTPVRGNVPTRIRKMSEEGGALILAKAGLDRLLQAEHQSFTEASLRDLIRDCRFMVLPLSLNPSAPAQGALAVEIARTESNESLRTMCTRLNDSATFTAVTLEREILKRYGGGCHQKIGVTILTRSYGQVISLRGLTDQGEVLRGWRIDSSTPWHRAADADQIFPLQASDSSWFERHSLPPSSDLHARQALVVARAEALPDGYKPPAQQLLWTAGVKTWKKLAEQGIWVNGTFDGLGESESPDIEALVGSAVTWTKLTHSRGKGAAIVATYRLQAKSVTPDLNGKTHFFWMSSTAFDQARQLFPQSINKGYNAAGPGSTFEHLSQAAGLQHPPKVFIDLEQFLHETRP